MGKIKAIWQNKWVKFSVVSFLYLLWFVVWSQIWWSIIGLVVIYDLYISKYYQRLFWNKHKKQNLQKHRRMGRSNRFRRSSSHADTDLFRRDVCHSDLFYGENAINRRLFGGQ